MKIANIVEFLVVVLTIGAYECATEANTQGMTKGYISATAKLRKCSTVLSDFLEDLCYETIIVVKRDSSPLIKLLTPPVPKPRVSRSLILKRLRRSEGIISECCERACTVEHLLLYCPAVSPIYSHDSDNS